MRLSSWPSDTADVMTLSLLTKRLCPSWSVFSPNASTPPKPASGRAELAGGECVMRVRFEPRIRHESHLRQ